MDKKFLHKVVDQIMSETRIDYDYMNGRIFLPYVNGFILFDFFPIVFPSYYTHFTEHCKNIYGLDFASELSQECIDLDIKFIKANAHEIPLPDKSIDLITSFDFMEHVHPDYLEKTINEMKRVGCKYMFHKIARGPSAAHHKKLGQLHLIQEDPEFWIEQVFRPDFSNVQWCGGGTFFIII